VDDFTARGALNLNFVRTFHPCRTLDKSYTLALQQIGDVALQTIRNAVDTCGQRLDIDLG